MFWRRREARWRKFGLVSGLRAVGAGLLSVLGAGRDIKGSIGVAHGGENIRGPQVSAKDEPKDLHLSRAITRLGRCAPFFVACQKIGNSNARDAEFVCAQYVPGKSRA